MDQAHVRGHVPDLAALERADEVPGEEIAGAPPASGSGPGRGSHPPARSPPRPGRVGPRQPGTSPRRGSPRPAAPARPGRAPGCPGSTPARRELPRHGRHTSPPCRPVTPPSRRWEKNRSAPAARAEGKLLDPVTTPAARASSGRPPGATSAPGRHPLARPANACQHLGADLVAAGLDARAEHRRGRLGERLATPRSTMPAATPCQPQWSIATALRRETSASGRQSAASTSSASAARRVMWPSTFASSAPGVA